MKLESVIWTFSSGDFALTTGSHCSSVQPLLQLRSVEISLNCYSFTTPILERTEVTLCMLFGEKLAHLFVWKLQLNFSDALHFDASCWSVLLQVITMNAEDLFQMFDVCCF